MKPDQKDARIQCFDQMESPLLHYAYGILRNDDAKDIVQEAFIRFFRVNGEVRNAKAWLYRTTRNLCIDALRKRRRLVHQANEEQLDFLSEVESEENQDPVRELEKKEKVGRVRHSLNLLPKDSQTLLTMKFDKKMSYKEISDQTGLSVSNVGYKLHVIISQLSNELQQEGMIG